MPRKPPMLHRFRLSEHSHRVELFLSFLGVPVEMAEVELGKGEHKAPEFLARNRFGQVPVLVGDGLVLVDSSAILVHLASVHDLERCWYPTDPERAAGLLLTGPGYARLVGIFNTKQGLARTTARQLFGVMDEHFRANDGFFVGARSTIADGALYTDTTHAPEGHISLEPYLDFRAWLQAVESPPGFVPMARTELRFGLPGGV